MIAKPPRARTPRPIEQFILDHSRRRCALGFHLHGDLTEKLGQIAHINGDRTDAGEDNLVFLCLDHHSLYDSTTSQHKNYTPDEVKAARADLYAAIARGQHLAVTVRDGLGSPPVDRHLALAATMRKTVKRLKIDWDFCQTAKVGMFENANGILAQLERAALDFYAEVADQPALNATTLGRSALEQINYLQNVLICHDLDFYAYWRSGDEIFELLNRAISSLETELH